MPDTTPVSAVLSAAADLIEPPGAWTQGVVARNAYGRCCYGYSRQAVCWCASAAISRVDHGSSLAHYKFSDFLGESIPIWNDAPGRTQAEVVQALRAAALKASAEGVE